MRRIVFGLLIPLLSSCEQQDAATSPVGKVKRDAIAAELADAKGDGFSFKIPTDWKRDDSAGSTSWASLDGLEQVTTGSVRLKDEATEGFDFVFKRLVEIRITAERKVAKSSVIDAPLNSEDNRGLIARLNGREGGRRFSYFQLGTGKIIAYLYYESAGSSWRADDVFKSLKLDCQVDLAPARK
jgi:hypothetical protein